MLKIGVCDDEELVRIKLITIIKEYFIEINSPVWVGEFSSGDSMLKTNIRFDIIFLDIEMHGINGIETAERLRRWDFNSKIIYVTNYDNYKSKAYKIHAFDYISKPVYKKAIYNVLKDAIQYMQNTPKPSKYAFKTKEGIIPLALVDIYYFEYHSKRVIINCFQKNYIGVYSLKELLEKFHDYGFSSPHKSFIINMLHIRDIKGFDIFMENGDNVPLAQKRTVDFKIEFNNFLQSTFEKI